MIASIGLGNIHEETKQPLLDHFEIMDLFECKPGKIIKAYMNQITEYQILNPSKGK